MSKIISRSFSSLSTSCHPVNLWGRKMLGYQHWYKNCTIIDFENLFLKSLEFLHFYISTLVNCQWSNWSAWGICSKSCDGGTQTSTRSKTVWETNGGTCSGSSERSRSCNSQSCPGEIPFLHFFTIFFWNLLNGCMIFNNWSLNFNSLSSYA